MDRSVTVSSRFSLSVLQTSVSSVIGSSLKPGRSIHLGAPKWILLPGFNDEPITELTDVCKTLRENLDESVTDLSMTPHAESRMRIFLDRLSRAERLLISRKKQKALEEMAKVIAAYLKAASDNNNQEKIDSYKFLIDMLTNPPLE